VFGRAAKQRRCGETESAREKEKERSGERESVRVSEETKGASGKVIDRGSVRALSLSLSVVRACRSQFRGETR